MLCHLKRMYVVHVSRSRPLFLVLWYCGVIEGQQLGIPRICIILVRPAVAARERGPTLVCPSPRGRKYQIKYQITQTTHFDWLFFC